MTVPSLHDTDLTSVKRQSHRNDARPARWKSSNFGQCVVVRWVCVTMRYSCVERAGPTPCIRRRSLCASGFLCMHTTVRGARRMNVHARRTPAMRRARWTNARHTRGTRGAHAGHALCLRRLRSSAHIAHRERTPSVLLTHVQRPAFFWRVPSVCVAYTQRVAIGYINASLPTPSSLLVRPSWVMT